MIDVLDSVHRLLMMHAKGALGGETMPEDALVGVVPQRDRANVLTLSMSLNYQRDAYRLWASVAAAWEDPSCRWLFDPHAAATSPPDDLRRALLRHQVALQPNRHPQIWQRVAKGIVDSSARGDVPRLLAAAEYDVAQLTAIMQVARKSDFPYLSGPKIFHYWLYVMEQYAGIQWQSREHITIAPDTHVLKASVKLGLCPETVLRGAAADRQAVADAWTQALQGTGLAPIDVHTPLWLWSRAGFPPLE